jgi:hypothetical protein
MGNCLKRSSLLGNSYLFEPLNPEEESIFNANKCNCINEITKLEDEIYTIKGKLELLERNTRENLKLLSDDIHYINTINTTTNSDDIT